VATFLAVALFAACGVYQLTPVKDRCLARLATVIEVLAALVDELGIDRCSLFGFSSGGPVAGAYAATYKDGDGRPIEYAHSCEQRAEPVCA
jgi:pimeloyl-ACP methyl ester carboxylesterase